MKPYKHLEATEQKCNFIMTKLFAIRKLKNLKLNSNLFKIFILPNFRLLAGGYEGYNKK